MVKQYDRIRSLIQLCATCSARHGCQNRCEAYRAFKKELDELEGLKQLHRQRIAAIATTSNWNNANDNLSRCMSAISQFLRDCAEGQEADRGFDFGEWSGAAWSRTIAKGLKQIAQEHGFSKVDDLVQALGQVTTYKVIYFEFGQLLSLTEDMDDA